MSKHKGVWVSIDGRDHELNDGNLELVGEGRRIADRMNERLIAVALRNISEEQIRLLAQHGAHQILTVEYPAPDRDSLEASSQVLTEIIKTNLPEVVLFLHTINSADLAGRIAGFPRRMKRLGSCKRNV